MSNELMTTLKTLEPKFEPRNTYGLVFESECLFASQALVANDRLAKAARSNMASLQGAILNVAAIGISLNPALKHAYLVPRKGAVCLDISYKGLVKLATDSGAIVWAKAVLVYDGDEFEWFGVDSAPVHKYDPFQTDRANPHNAFKGLRGGYCIAKLGDGYLVETMTVAEIQQIRDSSMLGNAGPWKTWTTEMIKKTLVKRASKSWPQSGARLEEAMAVINQHEGLAEKDITPAAPEKTNIIEGITALTESQVTELRALIDASTFTEKWVCEKFDPPLASITSIPPEKFERVKDRCRQNIQEAKADQTKNSDNNGFYDQYDEAVA